MNLDAEVRRFNMGLNGSWKPRSNTLRKCNFFNLFPNISRNIAHLYHILVLFERKNIFQYIWPEFAEKYKRDGLRDSLMQPQTLKTHFFANQQICIFSISYVVLLRWSVNP